MSPVRRRGFSRCMAIPIRHSDPCSIRAPFRTFFVSTSSWQSKYLFQSHRMAGLLSEVILRYRDSGKYQLHEFVIMPNHLHVLLTLTPEISIEKAVQFIKGGFSFRAKRELGFASEIWHRGFSEVRISGEEAYLARKRYIHENPVRARLVSAASEWEYGSARPGFKLDPFPEYLRG